MKKLIFRYLLYFQLIIQTFSTETDVKYEITNKEATTSHSPKAVIVTIVTGDRVNQTIDFINPNDQAANSTKQIFETAGEYFKPVYVPIVKMNGIVPSSTDAVEQNGLDAVFTEQMNLTTGITEIIIQNTTNITAVTSQSETLGDESIKSMHIANNDFGYVNIPANESINKIIELRSKYGYKNLGYSNIKSKELEFFGSFIKPIGVNSLIKGLNESQDESKEESQEEEKEINLKYILQWTKNNSLPFTDIVGAGQQPFIDRNCSYTNCVVIKRNTSNEDYKQFTAVVFFGNDLKSTRKHRRALRKLSKQRLPHQKYVFADLGYHKVPHVARYNNFFNWTFTYKLNSDLSWVPFVVKDVNGSIVAPNENVTWLKKEEMLPVSDNVMNLLLQKNLAIVWFYPCDLVPSKSICYMRKLIRVLRLRYGIHVDKISKCWYEVEATEEIKSLLSKVIKRDYYFYLVFEELEKEDYVSNEILEAVKNMVVPVVFGGANYSRFLPDGSYLNARNHTPYTLAREVYKLLRDFDLYTEYFKWTNHYSIDVPNESPQTDYICQMCEMMNNETKLNETTVYENFTEWWEDDGQKYAKIVNHDVPVIPIQTDDNINIPRPVKRKRPFTPREFIRQSAYAYTSFVDSIIDGVKTVLGTIIG